jgi:hypothetical protein
MGEAKRKAEVARKSFLEELEKWSFATSPWEERAVAEIRTLPVVTVTRYPAHVLEYMQMPARQCHSNARFMQDNDPEGRLKQITGWWVQGDKYVLHSVVDQHGQYVCVTPTPLQSEAAFEFVPDTKIEWRDEGLVRTAYRDDVEIGPGLRADPASVLADIEAIRTRLLSGMNPYRALRI